MISESIHISDIFAASKINQPVLSASKTAGSFAAGFRNSMKERSLEGGNPIGADAPLGSDAAADKIGQLASEAEDKYCSMCGSRIKEDGTCPICIVPVFISGNSGSCGQGISQADGLDSAAGNRVRLSYNRRKS